MPTPLNTTQRRELRRILARLYQHTRLARLSCEELDSFCVDHLADERSGEPLRGLTIHLRSLSDVLVGLEDSVETAFAPLANDKL